MSSVSHTLAKEYENRVQLMHNSDKTTLEVPAPLHAAVLVCVCCARAHARAGANKSVRARCLYASSHGDVRAAIAPCREGMRAHERARA